MKKILLILLFINFLTAKENTVFVHGLKSDSNTFLKMATYVSKDILKESQFYKLGYEHQLSSNSQCELYGVLWDRTDECINGSLLDSDYFQSTNTLRTIYGLEYDDFLLKNIYYRSIDSSDTYEYFTKFEEAPTDDRYSMNINDNILNETSSNSIKDSSVFIINLSNHKNLTFKAQGQQLSEILRGIYQLTGNSNFTLVGHSMGGLAIRAYMQNFSNPLINVNNIITIGTPHKGAGWELGGLAAEAIANLDEDSDAIKELNRFSTNNYIGVNFLSFVITGSDWGGLLGLGDGVVKESSQIPPNNISDMEIYFTKNCNDYSNCIPTDENIFHTKETGNDYIIYTLGSLIQEINNIKTIEEDKSADTTTISEESINNVIEANETTLTETTEELFQTDNNEENLTTTFYYNQENSIFFEHNIYQKGQLIEANISILDSTGGEKRVQIKNDYSKNNKIIVSNDGNISLYSNIELPNNVTIKPTIKTFSDGSSLILMEDNNVIEQTKIDSKIPFLSSEIDSNGDIITTHSIEEGEMVSKLLKDNTCSLTITKENLEITNITSDITGTITTFNQSDTNIQTPTINNTYGQATIQENKVVIKVFSNDKEIAIPTLSIDSTNIDFKSINDYQFTIDITTQIPQEGLLF